ncbi:MAG: hypothetical protein GX591_14180 [Planctomycetes bacterium]|nr:hypothetical protein [Planctomycetota bacterium]
MSFQTFLSQLTQQPPPSEPALPNQVLAVAAVLNLALHLAICVRGYVLLRMFLVALAVAVGATLGAWAVDVWRGGDPSGVDLLIGCGVAAGVMLLVAWLLYRTTVAAFLGICAAIIAVVVAMALGLPLRPQGLGVGIAVGLVTAVLVFFRARPVVVVLSALWGAAGAVANAAILIAEGPDPLVAWACDPANRGEAILSLLVPAVVLAILGAYLQFRNLRGGDIEVKVEAPKND